MEVGRIEQLKATMTFTPEAAQALGLPETLNLDFGEVVSLRSALPAVRKYLRERT